MRRTVTPSRAVRGADAAMVLLIGCVIVWVMEGPAYVADPYPPPGRDIGT